MNRQRIIEIYVGIFMLIAFAGFVFLALKVSGISQQGYSSGYQISASFSNVGGLKVRAPVTLAGVRVGEVSGISLDTKTFQAVVTVKMDPSKDDIPVDSSLSIYTEGLLGSNYLAIQPGYSGEFLKEGGEITDTHSALILENLISQFLFNVNKS